MQIVARALDDLIVAGVSLERDTIRALAVAWIVYIDARHTPERALRLAVIDVMADALAQMRGNQHV
jgi:predicted transcriptional regulator